MPRKSFDLLYDPGQSKLLTMDQSANCTVLYKLSAWLTGSLPGQLQLQEDLCTQEHFQLQEDLCTQEQLQLQEDLCTQEQLQLQEDLCTQQPIG